MDYQDHCLTQYEKSELLEIAAIIGLEKTEEVEDYVLIDQIRIHLLENGMISHPEVEEFVKVLRLYEEFLAVELTQFAIPPCFGYVSDQDPNCAYCLLYLKCAEKLINEKLPECYGELHSVVSEKCNSCMVYETCSNELPKVEDVPNSYEVYLFTREPFISNILRFLAHYRYYRCDWPHEIIKSKFARLQGLRIREAKIKEVHDRVIKEALYFGGPSGEKATERTPVTFNGARIPVYKENVYPIRLAWKFGDSEYP